ncbi:response regulator [Roseomonas genomospecies 6]|uniref:Response regulator n=1 Tax=Roseomonas genomospecies 6 TaxID=214106 RepID=A0A9W7TZU7_9PROT|nr:response regulator [Roseomonas genomospecies 6]KAA0683083.1 response regulator [Roseomonas genomospecies 6]
MPPKPAGFSIDADIRPPGQGERRAVVADDDPGQRDALARHLTARGFTVSKVSSGFEALSVIGAEGPAVAMLRRRMPEDEGDRAAALACMLYPRTRIILTVGAPDAQPDNSQPDNSQPDNSQPDNSPVTVLTRPVDLNLLDRCLDGL